MTDLEAKLLDVHFEDVGAGNFVIYRYPSMEIHVDIPFDDDPTPNECTVSIFNLSQSSISKMKKGINMSVFAGNPKDWGALLEGTCAKVETRYNGPTKETVITLTDYGNFNAKPANITFANNTRASTILNRLCAEMGSAAAVLELPEDKLYTSGYKVSGTIGDAFNEVIADCKASMYLRRGRIYIRNLKKGDDERFKLSSATGLIGSPERVETEDYKGYNIRCILQHKISTASIIELDTKDVKGTFRAKSGRHSFDGSSFITEALVIE
ncbi:phage protein [Carnobacterium sp. FSL E2-0243]|uniref:phage protein n=1 Tax=Carnobacterium TaxID=2747 RepID=UPI0030FA6B3F